MSLKSFFYFKIRTSVSIIILIFILIFIWGWFSSSLVLKAGLLPIEQKPDDFNVMCENVSFFTDDNINIKGWFLPSKEKSYKTIIICHGWGTNKSDVLSSTIFFLKRGFNLLYFDFRNHGESGGNKSSLGKLESQDLISAVDFLKTKKKQQSEKIGIYGVSMGASVAIIATALDKRISAVISDSPFSSFNYIISKYAKLFYKIPKYPLVPITLFFIMSRLGFNPEKTSAIYYVSKIAPRPIFIIHGEMDDRIPVSEGKILFDIANEPKIFWTVKNANHLESYSKSAFEYEKRTSDFFKKFLQ